jgi:threonine dehydratase
MNPLLDPLTDEEIAAARRRIDGTALRTPLAKSDGTDLWLKLECLQPYGSYNIRGATNALTAHMARGEALRGVVSASAGNFGQAIAAAARRIDRPVVIHVPDNAAAVKVAALERLGATVHRHSFDDWWTIMESRVTDGEGTFFHPVCEREVIAGAATIGEEILEDLPDVACVFIPIGGGGLMSGIAQAVKRRNPACRIVAVEVETATPLKAAFAAGEPVTVVKERNFIDGMGSTRVLDEMWPLFQRYVDEVALVSVAEIEAAIRVLAARHHVIAEGAGAAATAAAMRADAPKSVAIVSGGNLDPAELCRILAAG